MNDAPTPIGVAVVERDGRYLVGVRPEGVALAGYAEFPGGKCNPDETPEVCAVRECHEETGLIVDVKRQLDCVTWEYPQATVELSFFLCEVRGRCVDPRHPFRWVDQRELCTLKFPQANESVIRLLSR